MQEMKIEITEQKETNTTICTNVVVSHVPTRQVQTPLLCHQVAVENITTGTFPMPKRERCNIKGAVALGIDHHLVHLLNTDTDNTLINIAKGARSRGKGNLPATRKNSQKGLF